MCYRKEDCSPAESAGIMKEVCDLEQLLHQVKAQAAKKQTLLDEARRLQLFQKETKDLLLWATALEECLAEDENVSDVATAQALLKENQEMWLEIEQQQTRSSNRHININH